MSSTSNPLPLCKVNWGGLDILFAMLSGQKAISIFAVHVPETAEVQKTTSEAPYPCMHELRKLLLYILVPVRYNYIRMEYAEIALAQQV